MANGYGIVKRGGAKWRGETANPRILVSIPLPREQRWGGNRRIRISSWRPSAEFPGSNLGDLFASPEWPEKIVSDKDNYFCNWADWELLGESVMGREDN